MRAQNRLDASYIGESSVAVIADNDGVNAVWTRSVTANHQFLSAIHAILNPRATSFSRLVRAVFPLSDNALQALLAHGSQKFGRPRRDVV